MADLLLIIKGCVDETRETSDSLTAEQIKDFETMYDYITKMGQEENPPPLISNTEPKKRGRKKQTKPKNLPDCFIKAIFSGLCIILRSHLIIIKQRRMSE